jgi:WD40 repeat protein
VCVCVCVCVFFWFWIIVSFIKYTKYLFLIGQQVVFPRGSSDLFATCSMNDIRVWQTATSKELLRISVPNKVGLSEIVHIPEIYCVYGHPFVCPLSSSFLFFCDSSVQDCHCIAFHPDGKSIVSGWDDGVIRAFTPQTGKLMFEIPNAHSKGVTALAFTHDAGRLVSGGGEGLVRVWKLGKETQTLVTGMKEHKVLIFN